MPSPAALAHVAVGAAALLVGLRVRARRHFTLHGRNCMADPVPAIEVEPFMAESGYRPPRRCGVCEHPAVYVWEVEGFPFGACDLCWPLWFPDGIPAHVRQVAAPDDHLGQACEYGIRLDEDCGDPADRWVTVGGAPWWLCERHYTDVIEAGETDLDPAPLEASDGPHSGTRGEL